MYYSTSEVARMAGITMQQLFYLLSKNLIPDCHMRVAGKRAFSQAESAEIVSRVKEWKRKHAARSLKTSTRGDSSSGKNTEDEVQSF